MPNHVYLNGDFVWENEAKISVFDRGFLFGDGLFETMRAYRKKVFMLDEHLSRLLDSAKLLKITLGQEKKVLKNSIEKLIELNGLFDAYLRITVSRGMHSGRLTFDAEFIPTVVIVAHKLSPYPLSDYREGVKVIISRIRQNSFSPLPQHKTLNYLHCILAKEEARLMDAREAILLNSEGLVAEGATSNIFLIKNEEVFTPSRSGHLLPGITRKVVMGIMDKLKLKVVEGDITSEKLFEADEILITNSIMEVMPVTRINDHNVGEGKPGRICRSVRKAYREVIQES